MRFRSKTILGIALIELSLLSLLIIGTLHTLQQSNEAELMRRLSLSKQLLAASSKDALIAHDFATLNDIVTEMLASKQFEYLRFTDESGFKLSQGGNQALLNRAFKADSLLDDIGDGVFDEQISISVAGIVFGYVQFGISVKSLTSMIKQTWQWAITIAVLNIFFVGLFSWILGSYLARQLNSLQQASRRFAMGEWNYRIPIKGKDELSETANTFNIMVEELQKSYQALSSEIEERKQIAKRLQRANQSLERFTLIAAHHLQEPSRRILSFVQYLPSQLTPESLTAEAKTSLEFIQQSAVYQRTLIQDIEHYLSVQIPSDNITKLQPKKILTQAILKYQSQLNRLGAELIIHQDLASIMLDASRWREICDILLENALNYRDSERNLKIEIWSEEKNDKCCYYFQDNGEGILEEHYQRVFDVFERLHANNPKEIHTGIGLSIVKSIVESCDGKVYLQKRSEFGITVVLEFPKIIN